MLKVRVLQAEAEGKRETWRKKEEINRMKVKRGGQKRRKEVEKSELKLKRVPSMCQPLCCPPQTH